MKYNARKTRIAYDKNLDKLSKDTKHTWKQKEKTDFLFGEEAID